MTNRRREHYGVSGRLGASPEDVLVQTAYQHDCNAANTLMDGLHKADLAYAVMLIEQGIIPWDEGRRLIRGLVELSQEKDLAIDPALGDVYNSKDQALVDRLGKTAGWLHIGRARREAVNIAYLIDLRQRVLGYAEVLATMASTMLEVADREKNTVMLDYTYLHQAQPTTFGHYILTFLFPLLRDSERLVASYVRINRSPAGSGSVNGGNLPVDRERLSALLCFEGLAHHTRDAMWQIDTPLECISNIISVMVNLNRMSDEFQVWSTAEFGCIELPGSLCRASVIMPQKKNPYPLAYFRGVTGSLLGRHASFASYGKTMSGNPDSRVFVYEELPEAFERSAGAISLLRAVLENMTVNREVLSRRAESSFAYASDLAEMISMECRIDYRTAHEIVGATVRELADSGSRQTRITSSLLDVAAERLIGRRLRLDEGKLQNVQQPRTILEGRKTPGGAGLGELEAMIDNGRGAIEKLRSWIGEQGARLDYRLLDESIEHHLRD